MTSTGPAPPSAQLGGRETLQGEIKLRTGERGWKSILFWLLAIIAFIVVLSFL